MNKSLLLQCHKHSHLILCMYAFGGTNYNISRVVYKWK